MGPILARRPADPEVPAAPGRAESPHAHPGQGRLRHSSAAGAGRGRHPADRGVPGRGAGPAARFLGAILADLRRSGIVASQRGAEGGYRLARDPEEITIADVIRALDGPLAEVRGYRPEVTSYEGAAENLQQVWVAVRASLRSVLEKVSLADVIAGNLPPTSGSSSRTRTPGWPTDGEGRRRRRPGRRLPLVRRPGARTRWWPSSSNSATTGPIGAPRSATPIRPTPS